MGSQESIDTESIIRDCIKYAEKIRPFIVDSSALLHRYLNEGKSILFEGAQATLLDIDHGTYPVRHFFQRVRGRSRFRSGHFSKARPLSRRNHEGLHDTRWNGAISHRSQRHERRNNPERRSGIRSHNRPATALRVVRRTSRPLFGNDQFSDLACSYQDRRARSLSPRFPSAPNTNTRDPRSKISLPKSRCSKKSSLSIECSRAGKLRLLDFASGSNSPQKRRTI